MTIHTQGFDTGHIWLAWEETLLRWRYGIENQNSQSNPQRQLSNQ